MLKCVGLFSVQNSSKKTFLITYYFTAYTSHYLHTNPRHHIPKRLPADTSFCHKFPTYSHVFTHFVSNWSSNHKKTPDNWINVLPKISWADYGGAPILNISRTFFCKHCQSICRYTLVEHKRAQVLRGSIMHT